MEEYQLPIEHLSYSSLSLFCSNEQQFKKNYILGIWDYKDSPSAIVGKAFHRTMEYYYKGLSWDKAIAEGLKYIDSINDSKVDWGKTGSREQILKEFHKIIEFFQIEEPTFGVPVETELSVTTDFTFVSGVESPIPLKVVVDRIDESQGQFIGIDYKVVSSFTNKEEEQPDYIMQSIFAYYGIASKFNQAPEKFIFVEIKKSKNSDNSPQLEFYEIRYNEMQHYFELFEKLYTAVIVKLSNPDHLFLPNFSHPYNGKEAWEDFIADSFSGFEMPKNITHKSTLVQYTDKKVNYVESSVDMVANENLQDYEKIIVKLREFGIPVEYVESHSGANVTLHKYKPSRGIKMGSLNQYESDLALALENKSVRIAAPLLGTKFIGVEVSNKIQELVEWNENLLVENSLDVPIGQNVYGTNEVLDLAKAPHLLVAGTTGSGKSVFMNSIIKTLITQNTPEFMNLILIDPKGTEFNDFEGSGHLITEIVTEIDQIKETLEFAVEEMNRRNKLFKELKVKDISEYNKVSYMPKIVIVVDELADLMTNKETFEKEVLSKVKNKQTKLFNLQSTESKIVKQRYSDFIENSLVRLAQKARSVGIHLILATQRPSVDIITGILKANLPSRVAFMTTTAVDSQTILGQGGAEQLIGNGDLLFMSPKHKGLKRLQGYYI